MPNMLDGATGPSVATSEDKCPICDGSHEEPKQEKIEPTAGKSGWERDKSMADVFDKGDAKRCAIYENDKFPPSFKTEGHHSVALSSFVKAGKDQSLKLNHLLNAAGFHPNDPPNIIQLPARIGDSTAPQALPLGFQTFWVSVEQGKPLQVHLGRHNGRYFASSDNVVRRVAALLSISPDKCKEQKLDDLKKKLKKHMDGAVNYAFMCVTRAKWVCHPDKLKAAQKEYAQHGGKKSASAWCKITLDPAPFR